MMTHETQPTSSTYNMAKYYCDYQPENRHHSQLLLMKCYITLTGMVESIQLLSRGPFKFAP